MTVEQQRLFLKIVNMVMLALFTLFFFSTLFLGGSAFNDAANDYALYEQGHYYLVNHGHYTEVTYEAFVYAQISQIIGLSAFVIGIIISIINFTLYPDETQRHL